MILEKKNNEFVIKVPPSLDASDLQDLVKYLEYKENSKKLRVKQSEVDSLAHEFKQSIWRKFKENRGME